jgi:ACS family tartrate transporter-like MFS transporter
MTNARNISRVLRHVGWRILPLLLLLYFVAYLDRVNLGFAAASMQRDLGFSNGLYGTGAGLFFFGALIAQVPSNLLLARIGARRTIAALMIAWGLVSGATAFVHTPHAFLALRLLLGMAEAGFYPGVIYYLTLWLPRRVRGSFTATFLFAIPMASIFGGPLSSWILEKGTHGRFADWQTLLLCEAAPALLLGAIVPFLMTDTPEQASWLSAIEREVLLISLREDAAAMPSEAPGAPTFTAAHIAHIARFAAIYFTMQFALYTQSFWLPKILHDVGQPQRLIGWQVAAVSVVAAVGMLLWGRVVDRAPTARWTLWLPLCLAAAGYIGASLSLHRHAAVAALLLCFGLGAAGALGATPPFWTQTTERQSAVTLAITIAIVNALGNLGGFAGPALLGHLQDAFGGYTAGLGIVAVGLLLGVALQVTRSRMEA